MPANKYALLRYRVIDRCLTNRARPYPSKEDLREACEEALYGSTGDHISASTIEKDLWAMRNESELGYYAPIEYNKGERGYYYEDDEYSINELSLNDEDLMAIRFAAKTLDQFREIPIFKKYENAIDKIVNRIAISPIGDGEDLPFVQFETAPSTFEQGLLQQLCTAINDLQKVAFSYKKFDDSEGKSYIVEPLLLKEYRNRWYLLAKNTERGIVQTFGLDRMHNISITTERFTATKEFNPDLFFKHSIGITQLSNEPSEVVIRVTSTQASYLRSQPIHSSQSIEDMDDGFALVKLYVLITYELTSFILGLGPDATVLEPNDLAKKIRLELKKAMENYA